MPIYNKPAPALVYDLINQANPTPDVLPIAASPATVSLGVPKAATVPGRPELNTTITGVAVPGGGYIGRKPFNYRRIDLSKLLAGITVQISKFSANQGAANSVVFTIYNLLQQINQQYGLNLTTDDVADGNILRGNTQENNYYTSSVVVTAKANSLGFIGSFTLKWRGDAQDIASMIAVTELPARQYPGGNNFAAAHAVVVNNMAYGIDWTAFIAQGVWDGYPGGGLVPGNNSKAFGDRFINELNRLYGTTLAVGFDAAPAYSYVSWGSRVVDLSTQAGRDSAPEANADYYNRVLIMSPPDGAGSGVGTHYIHFNV